MCNQEKPLVGAFSVIVKTSRTFVYNSTWRRVAQGEGVRGERPTAARLGDIRRRRSAWRSFDGWNGLVFETGRLVVFVEIGL